MILWISGAYGVGKSTLAEALAKRMDGALLFDAEEVGNAVRENYPGRPYGFIFEDYPLWGTFCGMLLRDLHEKFGRDILVPMTLLRESSYEILADLNRAGIDTRLVVLEASRQTVHDRILARGETEDCWCMQNLELARAGSARFPGKHIRTDGRPVEALAAEVLRWLGREEASET